MAYLPDRNATGALEADTGGVDFIWTLDIELKRCKYRTWGGWEQRSLSHQVMQSGDSKANSGGQWGQLCNLVAWGAPAVMSVPLPSVLLGHIFRVTKSQEPSTRALFSLWKPQVVKWVWSPARPKFTRFSV